ncbi:MAG: EamA family transporter [Clostridiaceae bacterium]|nr:EamA family transporter [Clostridiaceae bacterium]
MSLDRIPVVLLLAASMAVALSGGIIKNYFCNRISGGSDDRQVYNGATSLSAAVILLLWGGISSVSSFTVVLGIAFGIVTALQQISCLKAMERGSWAYTSVIISLSTLIPALSGMLFWNERISWPQIAGLAMMAGCLILSADYRADRKKLSFQWLFYCFITFVCTGLVGVMQKWHQNSDSKSELNAFLIVAFFISFIYSAVSYALPRRRNSKKNGQSSGSWPTVVLLIGGGVCMAVNNKLNLFLSGVMESAVFFPIVNGGGLVLTTVAAVILFRERLTLKQWIGLSFGVASVVFFCNPFHGASL